jgi:hypothetical protein
VSLAWLEQEGSPYELRRLVHLPLFSLATKSAVAAGAAYWIGAHLPEPMGDSAYYASLGAVSVIYPAVTDSVREAMRALSAMALGVALAVFMQWVSWANWLTVGIVIGVATALGGIRWFAGQRTWIVTAGLFVLTVGGDDPTIFLEGYLTQLPLGAAVGLLVNFLVMPPLPLHDVAVSVESMRAQLVVHLRSISEMLSQEELPEIDAWHKRLRSLGPMRERMRAAALQARRAQRLNPRAKRVRPAFQALMERVEGVEQCSALVDVAGSLMLEGDQVATWVNDAALRRATSTTLAHVAEVLDDVAGIPPLAEDSPSRSQWLDSVLAAQDDLPEWYAADTPARRFARAERSIDALLEEVHRSTFADLESRYVAGSVALAARTCIETFVPVGTQARMS